MAGKCLHLFWSAIYRVRGEYYLLAAGILFYAWNVITPLYNDDYSYAFVWNGADGGNLSGYQGNEGRVRVAGFSDLFDSLASHYLTWGGRIPAHFFVQFLIWQGKWIFDICNTLLFLLTVLMVYWMGTGQMRWRKLEGRYILWILSCLWLCDMAFFDTHLWLTGSCNYQWMAIPQLLFFGIYWHSYCGDRIPWEKKYKNFFLLMIGFLGFAAGASNENSAAVIFMACAYIAWKKRNPWMLFGCFGIALGFASMILAPGNFQRAAVQVAPVSAKIGVFLILQVFRMPMLFLAFFALWKGRGLTGYWKQKIQKISCYIFLALMSDALMIIPPVYPAHSGYMGVLFSTISSVCVLCLLDRGVLRLWNRPMRQSLLVMMLCASLVLLASGFHYSICLFRNGERNAEILSDSGKENVVLSRSLDGHLFLFYPFKQNFLKVESDDPSIYVNYFTARYYGKSSVRYE